MVNSVLNRSHFNKGHIALNRLNKLGIKQNSLILDNININSTQHGIFIEDAVSFLKIIPSNSVQLVIIDPFEGSQYEGFYKALSV